MRLADLPFTYNRPPEKLVTCIKKLFTVYCTTGQYILRNTRLWEPRKTLLSYNYVFRQLLRLLDLWYETSWYAIFGYRFPLLKTRAKVIISDQRWFVLCQHVNENRRWFTEPETEFTPLENRHWHFQPLLAPLPTP